MRLLFPALALAALLVSLAGCDDGSEERARELEAQLASSQEQLNEALAELDVVELELAEARALFEARLAGLQERLGEALSELGALGLELVETQALLEAALAEESRDEPQDIPTLQEVVERGELRCGVKFTQPLFGFLVPTDVGFSVEGFDIEFCKAIAAAVLGDAEAVDYVDASDARIRFQLLVDGEVDVLIRTTTVTASRDADLGVDFAQVTFYGGQGFVVRAESDYHSTRDMTDNPTICVYAGTTTERNLDAHFRRLGLEYTPLTLTDSGPRDAFVDGRCDVWTTDQSAIISVVSTFPNPADFRVLEEVITKEPMAAVVRGDDEQWRDVVNWVMHGLIAAEEMGITRANVADYAANPPNIHVARLLAAPFENRPAVDLGFGLDPQFIRRAIAAVGNYGEIYERTVGWILPRACTLNALASEDKSACPPGTGGILYALPYR